MTTIQTHYIMLGVKCNFKDIFSEDYYENLEYCISKGIQYKDSLEQYIDSGSDSGINIHNSLSIVADGM